MTNAEKKKKYALNRTNRIRYDNSQIKVQSLENEIWKDITGYEGLYQISNFGRVKSLSRFKNKGSLWGRNFDYLSKEKLISISKLNVKNKYPHLVLYKNNVKKYYTLHRLIAIEFVDNPYNKPVVNHIDGNKSNYNIKNLEWVTRSENTIHALNNKLFTVNKGDNHYSSKLKDNEIKIIRELYNSGNYLQKEISKMFNVSASYISILVNNKSRI